jgi:hypothetical protein
MVISVTEMKAMRILKILLIIFFIPLMSPAQGVEVVPFVGYMFGGSQKFVEGKMDASDGVDYGIAILVPVHEFVDVEFNYSHMDGKIRFDPYPDFKSIPNNLETDETVTGTNYFQIGVVGSITRQNPNVVPFGSFSVGATLFSLEDYSDTWRFSITAGLGARFMFSEHIGVMLRGRVMLPMTFSGAGGYCGLGTGGTGCGLTVNSWTAIVQGDLNAGLIIRLGS